MTGRSITLLAGMTVVLWIVPSIGTQGMGTIGARFTHPDAMLIDTVPAARADARRALLVADGVAENALALPAPALPVPAAPIPAV